MSQSADIAIVGAGIVGLATGWRLQQQVPDCSITLIDKESAPGLHQSSHNSGVIHSGIYYTPGSLKASICRQGYSDLLSFADEHKIPYDLCGKIIAAVEPQELPHLERILNNGTANGLTGLQMLSGEEIRDREPNIRAHAGILVPQTGIIDYHVVALKLAELLQQNGASILLNHAVTGIQTGSPHRIQTTEGVVEADLIINCAGLYSDRIGKMTEPETDVQIIPFRGEFYTLASQHNDIIKHLIYPVPNPDFPFLGLHLTRMIGGGVEAGPNAVLAFRREGYSRWDLHPRELIETIAFPGFRKIALRYGRTGLKELKRSYSKSEFVKEVRRLAPNLGLADLNRGRSGVRAQTCRRNGQLTDDFFITQKRGVVNVWNAPSPAATACLAIGQTIANAALQQLSHYAS